MLQEDCAKKIGASIFLLVISSVVLYQSCRRASTIYFFELDTTTVIFMEKTHAVVFPLILSILLFFVYLGTKRSVEIQNERNLEIQRVKSSSALNSRKVSREKIPSRKMSICEDFDTQARIKRLLSDIEEEEKMSRKK
ncbi:unnamed protein product [Caenorhabditis angaria]|uniref:Uncharacterized protein n=1 Tax=Caenorhabditis angaria TaxID=860376 RepID=A0A9P1IQG4_9PELO|nr:unnamed protein product [Caenorhabditis angaria]